MTLKKYSKEILNNKTEIIKYIINEKDTKEILEFYKFDIDIFIQEYILHGLEFYIQTINNDLSHEYDHEINIFISNCKKNNIKDYDIFKIVKLIKYAFIDYFDKSNVDKNKIEKEINLVFESIFENILKQDITSQKIVEEQNKMLIQQSKSAAMGEIISLIAHQWRQPLQTISILVQKIPLTKMIEGEISDELVEKVLEDVNVQLDYMSKTIDDFRNFFKPNKKKDKIETAKLVDKTLDFLSYMINIDFIEVNIQKKENKVIEVYSNEVIQVLINIIKNARDVMIERGIEHRVININLDMEDSNVVIEVEDNAGGIPQDIIGKVFDSYFSTKSNKDGTGLGLYMSKNIIEKHCCGKLSVSNSKQGAVFKIELPLS